MNDRNSGTLVRPLPPAPNRTPWGIAGAPATRSTGCGALCAAAPHCSPASTRPGSSRCSPPTSTRGRSYLAGRPADHRRLMPTPTPAGLEELAQLGRCIVAETTSWPTSPTRASNGLTESINGRLEALRRNALGFRNVINYRIQSLLHCGSLASSPRRRAQTRDRAVPTTCPSSGKLGFTHVR